MTRTKYKGILVGAVSMIALSMAATPAVAEDERQFDIEAQPLAKALLAFNEQSGLTVAAPRNLVEGKMSPAVKGEMEPEEALEKILVNSGLKSTELSSGAYTITLASAPADEVRSFRIAQVVEEDSGRVVTVQDDEPDTDDEERDVVVATGTRIRGGNPTKPVQVYDRDAIEKSGKSSVEQFMSSLPQDFRGGTNGASPDGYLGAGASAQPNNEAASGVNLRGLGNEATLTLLNGRRIAPSVFGRYVDISMIPLGAIDRIEILTDGASAIYGADAVAGVVNIVTRDSYDGAETHLGFGGVTSGSKRDYTVAQTLGKSWDGGNAMLGLQYRDSSALPSSERSFTEGTTQPTDIVGSTEDISVYASLRQDISPKLDIFSDALYSDRDLFRQYAQSETTYSSADVDTTFATLNLGVGLEPNDNWRFELSGNVSNQETLRRNPVRQPLPAGYVEGDIGLLNTMDVWSVDIQGEGALLTLPGGTVRAAFGATYREEELESLIPYQDESNPMRLRAPSRNAKAVFAEVYVPLVGEENRAPLVNRLDVSAAIRYDEYSDFGDTTNPQIGVLWSPSDELDVRASWGTSFRAPNMTELINIGVLHTVALYPFASPGGGTETVMFFQGIDPDLGPEEADIWTVGFDYRPAFLEGASLSVGYYDIEYRNRIVSPPFALDALLRPEVYGSLIVPLADDAEAQALLDAAIADGRNFYDYSGGTGTAGVRYFLNLDQTNATLVQQSGFDVMGRYGFDMGENRYDFSVNATLIDEIITALTPSSTPENLLDRVGEPLSTRIRATVGWSRGNWNLNTAINYRNGYDDTTVIPSGEVDAWTTADVVLGWRADVPAASLLKGVRVNVGLSNVFDEKPPYIEDAGYLSSEIHYDSSNADPFGRQFQIDLRKEW